MGHMRPMMSMTTILSAMAMAMTAKGSAMVLATMTHHHVIVSGLIIWQGRIARRPCHLHRAAMAAVGIVVLFVSVGLVLVQPKLSLENHLEY